MNQRIVWTNKYNAIANTATKYIEALRIGRDFP